jgi:hypothetical protein
MAKAKSQQSLEKWTKQEWGTKSGKPSAKTGERYLAALTLWITLTVDQSTP